MPEWILNINDPLAAAIPRRSDDYVVVPDEINSEVSLIDGSVDTAELYEDVSADESFENEEFLDEVSRLEWDYFDSLHVDKAPVNSAVLQRHVMYMIDFSPTSSAIISTSKISLPIGHVRLFFEPASFCLLLRC